MPKKELTPRQEIFVVEYLKDLNATRAAIAAGYAKKGAEVTGSKLLRNPKVSAIVAKRTREHCKKAEITAERVLNELAKLAFFDPRKLYREDGSLKSISELDDDTAACIAGMDEEKLYENFGKGQAKNTGTIKKIKFADKGQNLERLGRYLKLFTEKHELEFKNLSQMTDDQLIELAGRLGVGAGIASAGSA